MLSDMLISWCPFASPSCLSLLLKSKSRSLMCTRLCEILPLTSATSSLTMLSPALRTSAPWSSFHFLPHPYSFKTPQGLSMCYLLSLERHPPPPPPSSYLSPSSPLCLLSQLLLSQIQGSLLTPAGSHSYRLVEINFLGPRRNLSCPGGVPTSN